MALSPIMDTAQQGLMSARFGMQLVSKNIANSATEGYSRQEVFFQSPTNGGVRAWSIRAQVDKFVEARLAQESQTQGRLDSEQRILSELTPIFGTTESGLDIKLSEFFASVSALSTIPEGSAERMDLLFKSEALVQEFNTDANALTGLQLQINRDLGTTLDRVNQITSQIAGLNQVFNGIGQGDGSAGDISDQRNRLLKELSTLISVDSFEDGGGNMAIFAAGGFPLVEGGRNSELGLVAATGFTPSPGVGIITPSGQTVDLTDRITNGAVAGMLRMRDDVLGDALKTIDRVAGMLTLNVNRVHAQGFGLDGSTGNDFFSPPTASTVGAGANGGGATVGAAIIDMNAVTLDDYEVVFTSATQFDLINTTQGTTTSGNAYTPGMTMDVDGLRLSLANGTGGPQSGDRFSISTSRQQAINLTMSLTDQNQIAASASVGGIPGDNVNALSLLALESTKLMDGGQLTLGEKFARAGARVGLEQQSVEQANDAQGFVMESLKQRRAEASSVSLDEEAVSLIQFQSAYEASARLLKLTDELLQTLINMV